MTSQLTTCNRLNDIQLLEAKDHGWLWPSKRVAHGRSPLPTGAAGAVAIQPRRYSARRRRGYSGSFGVELEPEWSSCVHELRGAAILSSRLKRRDLAGRLEQQSCPDATLASGATTGVHLVRTYRTDLAKRVDQRKPGAVHNFTNPQKSLTGRFTQSALNRKADQELAMREKGLSKGE